jgi:cytidine deaminase
MKEKLIKLLENSYSPYSNYQVSAIVVSKDNQEFSGVNVENISYGATICAERNAIFNAIASGVKKGELTKLYIMASGNNFAYPCFSCRQVISELMSNNAEIILINKNGETQKLSVKDLCPYPFDGDFNA